MQTNAKKKPVNWKRGLFLVGMCIVPILHFLIFYLYVNFDSIMMAFQTLKGGKMVWGFDNFELFFKEIANPQSEIAMSLDNTLIFFGVSLLVIMPLTTLIAYFIYKKIFMYKFFRVMFFLPNILSSVVLTIVFKNVISVDGPIAAIFQAFNGMSRPPEFLADSRYALNTIVAYVIWTGFGTNLILLGGAMNRIPAEVLEAARLDGVGMLRELVQIILPMVWPTMTTLIVFTFVGIFTSSGPILLFTMGAWDTMTISYWIYSRVYYGGGVEYASAVGLAFTVIALPIVLGVKWLMERLQDATEY